MLSNLFSSKTRVKLLKLFLFNPEEKFFVRELTRVLNEHLNSIRRELSNLEEMKFIKCAEKKDYHLSEGEEKKSKIQKKYYQANKNFPIFEELKALFLKSEVLSTDEIKEKVLKLEGISYFMLTGRFTNSESPTDILVVGDCDQDKLLELIKDLEQIIGAELNYTVMNLDEFKNRMGLLDRFLYKILDTKKIVVKDEVSENLNTYTSRNILKEEEKNDI